MWPRSCLGFQSRRYKGDDINMSLKENECEG